MKKDRTRPIPKTILAIADRCRGGQTLCKHLRRKDTGETEVEFFFEPSGRRCGPKRAQRAIALGIVTPHGDGLFGAETSQTFGAAHEA